MHESDNLPKTIGRYEIKRLLGAGAMGSVYLAEDPRIKRKLAIKVVKLDAIRPKSPGFSTTPPSSPSMMWAIARWAPSWPWNSCPESP